MSTQVDSDRSLGKLGRAGSTHKPETLILTGPADSSVIPAAIHGAPRHFSDPQPGQLHRMTLYDRYLIRRYLMVFIIMYVSTFGLYIVIDGFSNIDEFQRESQTALHSMLRMVEYYSYQSSFFLELIGPVLSVVTIMVVFALMQKHSEIAPILAAGIPTYRLALPFMGASIVVSMMLAANQELVIPEIAEKLQAPRKSGEEHGQKVEPIYDHNRIHIDGRNVFLESNRLAEGRFVLPAPELALELTTVRSKDAFYIDKTEKNPAGWLLTEASPKFSELVLTEHGKHLIHPGRNENEVFVISQARVDQLYNRSRSFKMITTPELVRRIRNPASGMISINAQLIHFHSRLTRPVLNAVSVMLIIPLIIRKDSRSLIMNMAICTGTLGMIYTFNSTFHYLGNTNILEADLAAWAPIILSGTTGAWLSRFVQS